MVNKKNYSLSQVATEKIISALQERVPWFHYYPRDKNKKSVSQMDLFGNVDGNISVGTADSLLIYAASFGVSIDWLYGVSQVPYTLQSIDYAEETYYQGIASAWNEEEIDINLFDDSVSERKFVSRLLENYCKHRTRQREFSPEARANIMVLHKFASSIAMLHQFNLELDKNRLNPSLFTKNEKKKYKQIVEKMVEVVNTTYPVYIISDDVSSLTEQ